jgi:hypothetical protein
MILLIAFVICAVVVGLGAAAGAIYVAKIAWDWLHQ